MFAKVVHSHWKELLSAAYIGSIILLLTAFFVFLLEQEMDDETNFTSMGDALWWAFITFYSVGYGDITPTTWAGKLVASCCTIFGMIVFNLPSGIVGAGLALQVSIQNRLKKIFPGARDEADEAPQQAALAGSDADPVSVEDGGGSERF